MISVFPSTATSRDMLGLTGQTVLDNWLSEARLRMVLNGSQYITLTIPYRADGVDKRKLPKEFDIIKIYDMDGEEDYYRARRPKRTLEAITIYAEHISYDLIDNLIEDINIVGKNGQEAMDKIDQGTQYSHPFTLRSDISRLANIRMVRMNPIQAMIGSDDNTFINRYGGEMKRQRYMISINDHVGVYRTSVIRSKRDLKGLEIDLDIDDVATRIMPMGPNGVLIPERYVDSPHIGTYPMPKIKVIEYDVEYEGEFKDLPHEEKERVYQALRNAAKADFDAGIDLPRASYRVDFVTLQNTAEYQGFSALENYHLGDFVKIYDEEYDLTIEAQVVDVEWDLIRKRYISMTLGNYRKSLVKSSQNYANTVKLLADEAREVARAALISADGKTTNYYGADEPRNPSPGDTWFKKNGSEDEIWVFEEVNGKYMWVLKIGTHLFTELASDLALAKDAVAALPSAEEIAVKIEKSRADTLDLIEEGTKRAELFAEQVTANLADHDAQLEAARQAVSRLPTTEKIQDEIVRARTEIESAVTQTASEAEERARGYAEKINESTIAVANEAKATAVELKTDLAKAKTDLTALGNTALSKASTAQQAVDDAKQQLGQLSADLQEATTYLITENSNLSRRVYLAQGYIDENKASLAQQAKDILAQAQAQTELVRRTETVEQTLDGQRTTITELGKGLDSATGQIQSVGNRTKTVEDGLSSLRSSYNQLTSVVNPLTDKVQSVEQRTADLQSGVNGIREDFSRLSDTVGRFESKTAQYERDANGIRERLTIVEQNTVKNLSGNMLVKSAEGWQKTNTEWLRLGDNLEKGKVYTAVVKGARLDYTPTFWTDTGKANYIAEGMRYDSVIGAYVVTFTAPTNLEPDDHVIVTFGDGKTADVEYVTLVQGKLPLVPWAPHWSEIKAQLAEYTAEYKRTAQGMTERLTALEVYKDGETERADKYFERAKEETAKQRKEIWKAVQDGYVANATYTEDVRGIRRQYTEIKTEVGTAQNTANAAQNTANSAKDAASTADRKVVTVTQNLADYKTDVDQQLTRLQQNQRDADGRISSLDTSMSLIPGQITTAVSAVEGKIPIKYSSINLVANSKINESSNLYGFGYRTVQLTAGKTYWIAARAKKTGGTSDKKARVYIYTQDWSQEHILEFNSTNYEVKSLKFTAGRSELYRISSYWFPRGGDRTGTADVDWYMVVESDTAPTTWSPAPEDLIEGISSMQTTVTQTADGVRQLSTKVTTAEANITTAQADIRRLNDVISNRLSETAINDIKNQVRNVESLYEQTAKSFTQKLTDVTAKLPKGFSGNMLVNSGKGWNNMTQTEYVLAEPIVKGQIYTIAARYWRQSGVTDPASILFWLVADHTTERINQAVTMTYSREVDAWVATFTAEGNAPAGKVVILTMTRGSASWATLAKGSLAISPWTPSAKDVTDQIDAKASEIRQEISKIEMSVQGIRGDMLHKNSITVQDDGIVLKAGKTKGDVAKAIASYFKLTPDAVSIITPLIKVSGDMIVDGGITAKKLDVSSVRTALLTANVIKSNMIESNAVRADTIAAGAVTTAKMTANSINGDRITAGTLSADKLKANSITAGQIAAGAIRAEALAAGAVTADSISAKAITSAKLDVGAVTAATIAANAVRADAIAAGAVTTAKMTANSINGDRITAGTLSADKLKANSITAGQIAAGTITSQEIKSGAITAREIAGQTITGDKMVANAIDARALSIDAITANHIKSGLITANHISAAGITANKIKGGTLTATNNNMRVDLNSGQVLFYNSQAALKRVLSGYPTQFVKFDTGRVDGRATGVTVIGSNRNGNEDSNGGGFVGLRLWNGYYNNGSNAVDLADVVADRISFTHSGFNDNPKGFYMDNWADGGAPRMGAFGTNKEQSTIEIGDVMMWSDENQGQLVGLRNLLIDMASEINRLSGRIAVNVPFYKRVVVGGTNTGWQSYK